MEVEYSLLLDDIVAFTRFHVRYAPKPKRQTQVKWVLLLLALLALPLAAAAGFSIFPPEDSTDGLPAGCVGVSAGVFLAYLMLALVQRKIVVDTTKRFYDNEESRWSFARRKLTITADGFEIINGYEQLRQNWSVVWLIDSTRDHAFFYITMLQAHIIPRRAFRDDSHFEEFVDLACRYHKGLGRGEPKSTGILDALPASSTGITPPNRN